jgi:hypothetical protein
MTHAIDHLTTSWGIQNGVVAPFLTQGTTLFRRHLRCFRVVGQGWGGGAEIGKSKGKKQQQIAHQGHPPAGGTTLMATC